MKMAQTIEGSLFPINIGRKQVWIFSQFIIFIAHLTDAFLKQLQLTWNSRTMTTVSYCWSGSHLPENN